MTHDPSDGPTPADLQVEFTEAVEAADAEPRGAMADRVKVVGEASESAESEIAVDERGAVGPGRLVLRRFLAHRGALLGLALILFITLLAFTSIGFAGLPGWWDKRAGEQFTPGGPTLSVVPGVLGGGGVHLGAHPFGTDDIGQDYFALTMRGTQISLIIAVVVGVISTLLGCLIGAVAGYFGRWIDTVLMRLTDVTIIMPMLVVAAVVGNAVGGSGPLLLAVVLGLFGWPGLARLVRAEVLSVREKQFVEASRVIGVRPGRIIRKHVLPNVAGVIVVSATLTVSVAILLESALSFLGFGVRAPDTSLGLLINSYRVSMEVRPWLFWWPGVLIILIALAANFVGDGLRDAFDPRRNGRPRRRTRRRAPRGLAGTTTTAAGTTTTAAATTEEMR